MTPTIRVATPMDIEPLSRVLSRAFANDPMAQWFVLNDEHKDVRFLRLFRWYLRESIPHGCTYTTDDHLGAALWMPPGTWNVPLLRQIRLITTVLGITGYRHAVSRILGADRFQRVHPKEPAHYYLAVLGVEPDFQGRGVGSALLKPVLQKCDEAGTGAYLETSQEKNLPLYTRHGFVITGEEYAAKDGPKQWLMWRDPR